MYSDANSMASTLFSEGVDAATLVEPRNRQMINDEHLNPLFVSDPAQNDLAVLLLFEHDDPSDTRLITKDGQVMFTFESTTVGSGSEMNIATMVLDENRREIGRLYRPVMRGIELISIGGGKVSKKSTFLSTPTVPMSKTIAEFEYQGFAFQWNRRDDVKRGFTMELFTNDQTAEGPIARYMDSRRDWDLPGELVIKQAKLEVMPLALPYIAMVVFSTMLVEHHKRGSTVLPPLPTTLFRRNLAS